MKSEYNSIIVFVLIVKLLIIVLFVRIRLL